MIGCIDGTYIPLTTPAGELQTSYVNRHDSPSLILQGICDAKYRFINVFTGASGRLHDARVYSLSDISNELPRICGNRYHVLGGGAYPLREWLLTPHRNNGNLTDEQLHYNNTLSKIRVLIENAFAILKARFRQLKYGVQMHKIDKIVRFIICCCVLHNLCIDNNDYIEVRGDRIDEIKEEYVAGLLDGQMRVNGERKRDEIKREDFSVTEFRFVTLNWLIFSLT